MCLFIIALAIIKLWCHEICPLLFRPPPKRTEDGLPQVPREDNPSPILGTTPPPPDANFGTTPPPPDANFGTMPPTPSANFSISAARIARSDVAKRKTTEDATDASVATVRVTADVHNGLNGHLNGVDEAEEEEEDSDNDDTRTANDSHVFLADLTTDESDDYMTYL